MPVTVATDLDGTVLFSARSLAILAGEDLSPSVALSPSVDPAPAGPEGLVEIDGVYGYMTSAAAATWSRLTEAGVVVPVTTRSIPQYLRLGLPGRPPRYAIVGNGAQLLVDGQPDPAWKSSVVREIARSSVAFGVVWAQAGAWHAEHGFKLLGEVEECFVYLTVVRREPWLTEFASQAQAWAEPRGWRASLQGRKLYLVPLALDKAAAVTRLAARLGADEVVAGGDSLLDAEMLRVADAAIRPGHGELHRVGFTAPRCRVASAKGIAAGEEIISWYAQRCGLG